MLSSPLGITALNANDWLNNFRGSSSLATLSTILVVRIGGPVIIPGTSFNKNRDKLFFFAGFEYF